MPSTPRPSRRERLTRFAREIVVGTVTRALARILVDLALTPD